MTVAAALLIGLALAWTVGPLADAVDPRRLAAAAARLRDWPYAPLVVAVVFVLACLVGAPGSLLIGTTVLLFGPLRGALYAYADMLLSGSVIYVIGRHAARGAVDDWLATRTDSRWSSFNARIAQRGLIACALTRLTPIPYPIQNVLLGASRIGYRDFLLGTMLGLIPVMLLMAGLGTQFNAWMAAPDLTHLALLIAALLVALAIVWWLGRRVLRR